MLIPLLMAGASLAKGAATIGQGFMQGRAYAAQAQGARIERDMAYVRINQAGAASRNAMATAFGSIDNIRSTRGVSLDSATGQAIGRRTKADFYREEAIARLGELNRAAAADREAKGLTSAARWATPIAVLNAAGDFASAASYGSMAFGRKPR